MYNVLILLSTNIHEDVISNCKYREFIQTVSVLFLLFLVVRTYNIIMLVLLYYCVYVIISILENYIVNYIISNHTKILIISYSSSRLHKKYIS